MTAPFTRRALFAAAGAACLCAPALAACTTEVTVQPSVEDTPVLAVEDGDAPVTIAGGIDFSRIAAAKTAHQVIVVSGHDTTDAHVVFAEYSSKGWEAIVDTEGHVGMNGIDKDIDEWSVKTPEGVFGLGFAFGIKENPGTAMEYRLVDENDYWVDDPDSPHYNQWVDTTETEVDWNSAEHLIDYTVPYAYCIFIQYNWPVEGYARSSAIFLHCIGNVYTGGCVSIPEEDMVTVLKHIDAEGAIIVIANGDDIYNY